MGVYIVRGLLVIEYVRCGFCNWVCFWSGGLRSEGILGK